MSDAEVTCYIEAKHEGMHLFREMMVRGAKSCDLMVTEELGSGEDEADIAVIFTQRHGEIEDLIESTCGAWVVFTSAESVADGNITWKIAKRYPGRRIEHINMAWLMQGLVEIRNEIRRFRNVRPDTDVRLRASLAR